MDGVDNARDDFAWFAELVGNLGSALMELLPWWFWLLLALTLFVVLLVKVKSGRELFKRFALGLPLDGRPKTNATMTGAATRKLEEFADTERVSGAEYARRTGMSVTTVNRTLRDHADEMGAPRRDARGRMNALRLASFWANVRNTSPRKIPAIYSLATLQAWPGPSDAPHMDPLWFGHNERLTLAEFCRRTDKDYGTAATALRRSAYAERAPERGEDGQFNAREIARFLDILPGRRGKRR